MKVKRFKVYLILILIGLFVLIKSANSSLTCSIVPAGNCNSPNLTLFYMKNDTGGYENSHLQNYSHSPYGDYPFSLCCSSNLTLGRNCAEAVVIRLFNITNSHLQIGNYSGGNIYSIPICLSVNPGNISCNYKDNNCDSGYSCLGSMASSEASDNNITNAHYGSCNKYTKKICCKVGNTPPVVTLISPPDNNATTNRKPLFQWSGYDAEGDPITYEVNITAVSYLQSPPVLCSESINFFTSSTSFTPQNDLKCLYDNGYQYVWSVRANDSFGFGEWAQPRKLNITALTKITLVNPNVTFFSLDPQTPEDTSDDNPTPFILRNDGNSITNVSINSTPIWEKVQIPSENYKFKVRYYTGHEGAFNWEKSTNNWAYMPITSKVIAIAELNYTNNKNMSNVDIYLKSPSDEPPGLKSATVVFTANLAE
ncbi:MAG: hypothetical protein QW273_04005 [Candidatus Pacearchaeota archaeon]